MLIVRYTTKFYSLGYNFPREEAFNTTAEYMSWREDMEELHGKNFFIIQTWENTPTRRESTPKAEPRNRFATSCKIDGSTDACILGLDY